LVYAKKTGFKPRFKPAHHRFSKAVWALLEGIFRKSSGRYKPGFKPLTPHHRAKMAGAPDRMAESGVAKLAEAEKVPNWFKTFVLIYQKS